MFNAVICAFIIFCVSDGVSFSFVVRVYVTIFSVLNGAQHGQELFVLSNPKLSCTPFGALLIQVGILRTRASVDLGHPNWPICRLLYHWYSALTCDGKVRQRCKQERREPQLQQHYIMTIVKTRWPSTVVFKPSENIYLIAINLIFSFQLDNWLPFRDQ